MSLTHQQTVLSLAGQTFSGLELPRELPLPIVNLRDKEWYMSDGGPGNEALRVIEPLPAHISHADMEFSLFFLTRTKMLALQNAAMDRYTEKTLTVTSAVDDVQSWKVLFAPGGFVPKLSPRGGYPERRYSAKIKLRILSVVVEGS